MESIAKERRSVVEIVIKINHIKFIWEITITAPETAFHSVLVSTPRVIHTTEVNPARRVTTLKVIGVQIRHASFLCEYQYSQTNPMSIATRLTLRKRFMIAPIYK